MATAVVVAMMMRKKIQTDQKFNLDKKKVAAIQIEQNAIQGNRMGEEEEKKGHPRAAFILIITIRAALIVSSPLMFIKSLKYRKR